jgi:hypothetical protein
MKIEIEISRRRESPRAPSGRATKAQLRDHLGASQHLATASGEAWTEFLGAN